MQNVLDQTGGLIFLFLLIGGCPWEKCSQAGFSFLVAIGNADLKNMRQEICLPHESGAVNAKRP